MKLTLTLGVGDGPNQCALLAVFTSKCIAGITVLGTYSSPSHKFQKESFNEGGSSRRDELVPLGPGNHEEHFEPQVSLPDAVAKWSLWQREALSAQRQPSRVLDLLPS